MCGILGSVNKYFDDSHLDLIKHRGPDDSGFEMVSVNEHVVRFAQRRLSILDLSPAGHQPMFTDCGNFMIILNGEIYNHMKLREKLPDTINYMGHSDTETILYYLREFGVKGIRDFNGIFAFALLDKLKNTLLLARDPFGVKPLYYSSENSGLVFSSEIRPLSKLLVTTGINKDALATNLRLRYNPAPYTLHSEIRKIHPGHYLVFDLKSENLEYQSHSYIDALPATLTGKKTDLVREYGEKFEEAVKSQLLSDVEVGVLLSGGIDSALVAFQAKKHYTGNLKAFTIGFEGTYSEDEIEDAAETAQILGLDHKYRKISFSNFLEIVRKCTEIVEEPLATTSIIPMYYLSELASAEVKVALTGQGADEPLGGYTRYKSELIRNKVPRFMQIESVPFGLSKLIRNENISKGMDSFVIKNETDRFLKVWEVFNIREIDELISVRENLSNAQVEYFYNLLNCGSRRNSVERMMALDTRLNLADDLLNYTDKITMNFALECRVPMLDLDLVRFIESLPVELKLNISGGKIIHKQYAKQVLPDKIINRRKKGFLSPTNNWFKDEADSIKDILLQQGTNFSKVFRQSVVAEIIKKHQLGYNQEKKIFLLLSICFWLETWTGIDASITDTMTADVLQNANISHNKLIRQL
jgi:asparagine synthase (glutamine-hydrolysing)